MSVHGVDIDAISYTFTPSSHSMGTIASDELNQVLLRWLCFSTPNLPTCILPTYFILLSLLCIYIVDLNE